MIPIYLASQSPRRKMLLEEAGYAVTVIPSEYVEPNDTHQDPCTLVMMQGKGKALWTDPSYREKGIVIGADTIVQIDGTILGKPKDKEEALHMLRFLRGKSHVVITGVALLYGSVMDVFYNCTTIYFSSYSDEAIESYLGEKKPYDKAGSYGLQELDPHWVETIEGSYSNVVGLPIEEIEKRIPLLTVQGALF